MKRRDRRNLMIFVGAVVLVALLLIAANVYAKDICWVEDFEAVDYTVCQVPGGIYILTPTPTPTIKPKQKPIVYQTPICLPMQCQILFCDDDEMWDENVDKCLPAWDYISTPVP